MVNNLAEPISTPRHAREEPSKSLSLQETFSETNRSLRVRLRRFLEEAPDGVTRLRAFRRFYAAWRAHETAELAAVYASLEHIHAIKPLVARARLHHQLLSDAVSQLHEAVRTEDWALRLADFERQFEIHSGFEENVLLPATADVCPKEHLDQMKRLYDLEYRRQQMLWSSDDPSSRRRASRARL